METFTFDTMRKSMVTTRNILTRIYTFSITLNNSETLTNHQAQQNDRYG